MNKYIIVDAEAIQKRIEELEQKRIELINDFDSVTDSIYKGRQEALNELLSQSTPLIPEIEKAFDKAFEICITYRDYKNLENNKQDYISNLKLDI